MMRGCLIAVFLLINLNCVDALGDMNICYILDGILILYGIILTALYCRLRMNAVASQPAVCPEKQAHGGGIYAVRHLILMLKKTFKMAHDGKGLTPRNVDVYETIKVEKRPIV